MVDKTIENLEKLMNSVDCEGDVKPKDRLKSGSPKEIKHWLNRGWILPNNISRAEPTKPTAFHITGLAISAYEFAKRKQV